MGAKGFFSVVLGCAALCLAYFFRLHAVRVFGRVIHEFDPWFNYRATTYLADHGWAKFFTWFDYMSWYPLGRPVGTTIYPGMQITAVCVWRALEWAGAPMSLNDVCVYMPAWGGVVATFFVGLLARECAGRDSLTGAAAALVMAVIPAHLMRSPAGKFDNECVAVPAMCAVFYFWCRSLRAPSSWWIGALAGLSYFYMAASWGGYIFAVNLIAAHALVLCATGQFSAKLHRAYTLFYVVGTAGAVCVPPIGWAPLRSLEQMPPLCVFLLLQVLAGSALAARIWGLSDEQRGALTLNALLGAVVVAAVAVQTVVPAGYFGPLSSRVRGLFVSHTRTGNPLVDSVAEHQATSPRVYWQFFHCMCTAAPVGLAVTLYRFRESNAGCFAIVYGCVSYYFSTKMNRLVLLCGPIAAVFGGVAVVHCTAWAIRVAFGAARNGEGEEQHSAGGQDKRKLSMKEKIGRLEARKDPARGKAAAAKGQSGTQAKGRGGGDGSETDGDFLGELNEAIDLLDKDYKVRKLTAGLLLVGIPYTTVAFFAHSDYMARAMSQPSIMRMHRTAEGAAFIIDDYREAYWWLRDNTPEDSRVMAWWDYGYQIAGIANRTTIADGNTWNHEHIAMLGRCLVSPEATAHSIVRHLADYVLVWAGGGGDDLAKSPHMARISNSVYKGICPDDPTCSQFGFTDPERTKPTPMMEASLLYRLHGHNQKPGVQVNSTLFEDVFKSKHGLVRIFKVVGVSEESRRFAADPANRKCDAPGSWYCEGQYPPALHHIIKQAKNFAQLEDFNRKLDEEAEKYQQEYHRRMARPRGG